MRLATVLTPVSQENLTLAAQCGVTDLVLRYPGPNPDAIAQAIQRVKPYGMQISAVEGYLPIERMKLGVDDCSQMRAMQDLLRSMSDHQIKLLCYNFMAGTDWARTRLDAPERGGAKTTAFHLQDVQRAVMLGARPSDDEHENIARSQTPQRLWENLDQMLGGLLPVAESCGVTMAMHPDDPPLPSLLDKPRIMHRVECFDQLIKRYDSPSNAICFCLGSFVTMGCDIAATIKRFGHKIQYVHFRDVRGVPESFAETFHDNGPTDMAAVMRALRQIGFNGPIRPDHVPQMFGEDDGEPGYTMLGRLFAYGYIRGLMHATEDFPRRNQT